MPRKNRLKHPNPNRGDRNEQQQFFSCLSAHPVSTEQTAAARPRVFYTPPHTGQRPRAQRRPLQPQNRPRVLSSSPARPARCRPGCRCPGRRSLPGLGLPTPFPRPRLSPAGGPGGRTAPAQTPALTGHARKREPHRSAEPLTTAQPPRPARRHLGSQARPLVRHHVGVPRA